MEMMGPTRPATSSTERRMTTALHEEHTLIKKMDEYAIVVRRYRGTPTTARRISESSKINRSVADALSTAVLMNACLSGEMRKSSVG
jgi:hypothetical protein